jgi:DNA polymerase-3 subunit epsilon
VTRYVVVDLETSGLDPRRDRLIAIGAVALTGRRIRGDDCFEAVLRQPWASAGDNILIHRIGGERQLGGVAPAEALEQFLEFAGDAPLVAFRADFDRTVLERAVRRELGTRLRNAWLDLAVLLPALHASSDCVTMEQWLGRFGIPPLERHDALCDALAEAQLLQVCLAAAEERRFGTLEGLLAAQKAQRWLGRVV